MRSSHKEDSIEWESAVDGDSRKNITSRRASRDIMPGKQVSPSISFSHSDEGDDGGQKVLRVKKAGRQRGRGG